MKSIFFDLDGTLLPMDEDVFVKYYFGNLAKRMVKFGIEPKNLIDTIWKGTYAMMSNDGSATNETLFWNTFEKTMNIKREVVEDEILDFYKNEFNLAIAATNPNPQLASKIIKTLKNKGYDIYLTTNPIFPSVATLNRIKWAGLDKDDFKYITTYENCRYSKPSLGYYSDVIEQFNLNPEELIMVGNDLTEDVAIQSLGAKTIILEDCLVNKRNVANEAYMTTTMAKFAEYIEENF